MTQPGGGSEHPVTVTLVDQQFLSELQNLSSRVSSQTNSMQASFQKINPALASNAASAATTASRMNQLTGAANNTSQSYYSLMQHSAAVNKALFDTASAARGMAIGFDLASGRGTAALMQLTRIRWTDIPILAASVAISLVADSYTKLEHAASGAAASMETAGQQAAAFFQSGKVGMAMTEQANQIAIQYGIPAQGKVSAAASLMPMLTDLQKFGMNNQKNVQAVLNAAAATGVTPDAVTKQLNAIMTATSGTSQQDEVKKFAETFNLPAKNYANSVALMTALNDRFQGSAAAMANTFQGKVNSMKATWNDFLQTMGTVVNAIFGPLISMFTIFFGAMAKGFAAARDQGKATGDLTNTVQNLQNAINNITPFLERLGYVIGTTLYNAVIRGAQVIKTLIDTAISLWNRLKPVIDAIQTFVTWVKHLIDWLISWYQRNKDIVDTLLAIYLGMMAFNAVSDITNGKLNDLIKGFEGVGKAIGSVPRDFAINVGQGAQNIQSVGASIGQSLATAIAQGLGFFLGGRIIGVLTDVEMWANIGRAAGAVAGSTVALVLAAAILTGLALEFPKQAARLASVIDQLLLDALLIVPLAIGAGILALVNSIHAIFTGGLDLKFGGLGEFFKNIVWDRISVTFGDFLGWVAGQDEIFRKTFYAIPTNLSDPFVKQFRTMWSEVEADFDGFTSWIASIWSPALIGDMMKALADLLAIEIPGLAPIFKEFKNFTANITTEWIKLWPELIKLAEQGVKDLWDHIKSKVPTPGEIIKGMVDPFIQALKTGWKIFSPSGVMVEMGDNIMQGLANGITSSSAAVYAALSSVTQNLISQAQAAMNNVRAILNTAVGGAAPGHISAAPQGTVVSSLLPTDSLKYISDLISQVESGITASFAGVDITSAVSGIQANPDSVLAYLQAMNTGPDTTSQVMSIIDMLTNVPGMALGGVVPGPIGSAQLVLAHAGEKFGGVDSFANARGGGGGQTILMPIYISDSVVTNDRSMRQLTDNLSSVITARLGLNRLMTVHRQ